MSMKFFANETNTVKSLLPSVKSEIPNMALRLLLEIATITSSQRTWTSEQK
jgi:hypothetical protein